MNKIIIFLQFFMNNATFSYLHFRVFPEKGSNHATRDYSSHKSGGLQKAGRRLPHESGGFLRPAILCETFPHLRSCVKCSGNMWFCYAKRPENIRFPVFLVFRFEPYILLLREFFQHQTLVVFERPVDAPVTAEQKEIMAAYILNELRV
ncbi:MAG: hypothetical protein ACFWUD_05015 [Thermocaproicibacter melissae]|jgi:hypothetical protein